MNWIIITLIGYLFVALHQGLAPVFSIDTPWGTATPRLVLVFAVYLGLLAPTAGVVWAWALIGFVLDLLTALPGQGVIIGPYTIGYLIGAIVVLQLRSMVLRTHPVSHAFCVLGAGVAVHGVVSAIMGIRQIYDPAAGYDGLHDAAVRMLAVAYTVPFAAVLAWPLIKAAPAFGFSAARGARA